MLNNSLEYYKSNLDAILEQHKVELSKATKFGARREKMRNIAELAIMRTELAQ